MSHALIWLIVGLSVAGVILRPWGVQEFYPALGGAVVLVLSGLLPAGAALRGVGQGMDVYLFLIGMMLLAELAADQGLFAWAAGLVAQWAAGSARRLFGLVYAMAVVVTVFLSNPANLVVYGPALPPLGHWLLRFGAASILSIAATFLLLRFTQRRALTQPIEAPATRPKLSEAARHTGIGLLGTALVLMTSSALGVPLGLPTFLAALATTAFVLIPARQAPWRILKDISWGVLPLVAGLFVMVTALDRIGVASMLGALLQRGGSTALWWAGGGLGVLSNVVNNLPAGLLAGHALAQAHLPPLVTSAALIGVDLGPNLSVTGSLATILWLIALRRAGLVVTAWQFLRLGALIMPPALLLALGAVALSS